MKFAWILLLGLAAGNAGAAGKQPLQVMTFNLRYAHQAPPNAWPDRLPVMLELLRDEAPDVIGTQEGLYPQLVDLDEGLPDYAWIGLGRDGGSRGEFMAIFYRHDRLVPVEYDHYWLSDTPETMASRSWGNQFNRMVTWVRFRDRRDGCEFYVVNTHFDHEVQRAREKSADLLLERVTRFEPALPVLLLGDFNAAAGDNPVHDRLTAPDAFVDTWNAVHDAEPEVGTFHDFKGIEGAKGAARIDWILARGAIEVESSRVLTFARDGGLSDRQYPSDHFPVAARIRFERCR